MAHKFVSNDEIKFCEWCGDEKYKDVERFCPNSIMQIAPKRYTLILIVVAHSKFCIIYLVLLNLHHTLCHLFSDSSRPTLY